MNEEIDIIELLKRVKEGKAPKKIEVEGTYYEYQKTMKGYFRSSVDSCFIALNNDIDIFDILFLDTKIKILDKPIIEELEISTDGKSPILIKKDGKANNLRTIDVEIINKLNEIIKKMNNKENKDE